MVQSTLDFSGMSTVKCQNVHAFCSMLCSIHPTSGCSSSSEWLAFTATSAVSFRLSSLLERNNHSVMKHMLPLHTCSDRAVYRRRRGEGGGGVLALTVKIAHYCSCHSCLISRESVISGLDWTGLTFTLSTGPASV